MNRGSGVLFHLTSLPSHFGIGDMGPSAYRFADFLHASGQRYWQILPLNPTNPVSGNSPYQSISAFACNPLLLSPEIMIRDGFRCAYCGAERVKLTIDHIIPRSRGGRTDFDNCVSCCRDCNAKKGDCTPSEARLFLKVKIYQPTISEFLRLKCIKLGIDSFLRDLEIY